MASKEVIEGIESAALECSLCMNRFTRPKVLTCVHSFCLRCLEEWVKKSDGVLSCPTCRDVCQIPEGGLEKLQNNIFINGLLDYVTTLEQKTAPNCSLCSTEASFFCRDCDELYCTSHRNDHTKMKMSQHHCIITIEEYTVINPVERLASKSVYCCNHNMPLHFFCGSCKVPVCVGCTLVEHPIYDGHNIINIETAFESFAKLSESFINKADEKLIDFHEIAKQLKEKEELEMLNYKKWEAKITEEADKAYQLIDHYKQVQLKSLESSHWHNLKLISANVSDVELAIAKFSSMQGIVSTLIHSPNHAMALRSSSDVSKRIVNLAKQTNISDDMLTLNLSEYNNTRFEVKTVNILHGDDDYEAIMTLPKSNLKTGGESENCSGKDLAKLWHFNKDTNEWIEHDGDTVEFIQTKKTGRIEMQIRKVYLNHLVTANSKVKAIPSSDHAWVWSESEFKKYALVFKELHLAREFKEKFDKMKKRVKELEVKAEAEKTFTRNNMAKERMCLNCRHLIRSDYYFCPECRY